jgi:hypothetical protein
MIAVHRRGMKKFPAPFRTALCLVLAFPPLPALAGVERAPDRSLATTCSDLRAAAEAAAKDGGEKTRLLFEGRVARIEKDGAMTLVFVCDGPDAMAACIEYRDDGARVGDRVRVHGVVAGTWDKGPMLDPCATTRAN